MDRTVLVTGGTGAIGRELVRRLAADPHPTRVVVLTRAAREAEQISGDDPVARIWNGGGARVDVRVVRGDLLAGPGLGLSPAARDELAATVTDVLHLAAETRFTRPIAEIRAINVGGTIALLDFASRCRSVRRIGCFSTVYVAGRRTGRFTEDDLDDAGAGFANTYERSKREMEREVRRRMGDLPIAVYRASTVIGDSVTGAAAGDNAFHHAVRLIWRGLAPMVPGDPAHRVDLVAVDYVAGAAAHLFGRRFEAGATYHLCSGPAGSSTLAELIDAVVRSFHRLRPEWRRRGFERPAIVDLATWELFARSVEETGNPVLLQAVRAVQGFATQLGHPKEFDATRARTALAGSGLRPPPVLDWLPGVIRTVLQIDRRVAA